MAPQGKKHPQGVEIGKNIKIKVVNFGTFLWAFEDKFSKDGTI